MNPAPCAPIASSATVVECYDLDAVALVRVGADWFERDLTGQPDPAFTIAPSTFVVLSTLTAVAVIITKLRRKK